MCPQRQLAACGSNSVRIIVVNEIDWSGVEVLTFDCYGTLIDWETGIVRALRGVIGPEVATDDELLAGYAGHEAAAEAGPWKPYRQILRESMSQICRGYGLMPTSAQAAAFGGSVADWPAFPDSAEALTRLKGRFGLGIITNCDDDLFGLSDRRLGQPFRWVVTAQQAESYKPTTRNFELAFARIDRPRESIVHVAQSLYHDHIPAQKLGLRTVWINRRQGRPGGGATPPAEGRPDLTFPDLATFADAGPEGQDISARSSRLDVTAGATISAAG